MPGGRIAPANPVVASTDPSPESRPARTRPTPAASRHAAPVASARRTRDTSSAYGERARSACLTLDLKVSPVLPRLAFHARVGEPAVGTPKPPGAAGLRASRPAWTYVRMTSH